MLVILVNINKKIRISTQISEITEFKENVLKISAPNSMAYQYKAKIDKNRRN